MSLAARQAGMDHQERMDGEPHGAHPMSEPRVVRIASLVISAWALLGGTVLLAIAAMTGVSAVSHLILGAGFAVEHELTKHFVAIAIFAFLPYCQLVRGNVSVDIFTSGLSKRSQAAMAVLSACFALAFSILMLRQMSYGFESYLQFREVTPVLGLPLWTAFPPILVSLALLFVAALISIYQSARDWRALARP